MTQNATGTQVPVHSGQQQPAEAQEQQQQESVKASELSYRPNLDLFEFDDRYEIQVELPGTTPNDIDVTVNNGVLGIEGRVPPRVPGSATPLLHEFGVGDYRRRLRLGEDVDSENLSATYTDGVLTLHLPKRAGRQARRVPISGG